MHFLNPTTQHAMWDYMRVGAETGVVVFATYSFIFSSETINYAGYGAIASAITGALTGIGATGVSLGYDQTASLAGGLSGLIALTARVAANPTVGNGIAIATLSAVAAVGNRILTHPLRPITQP
jgi:hypothetical protein